LRKALTTEDTEDHREDQIPALARHGRERLFWDCERSAYDPGSKRGGLSGIEFGYIFSVLFEEGCGEVGVRACGKLSPQRTQRITE